MILGPPFRHAYLLLSLMLVIVVPPFAEGWHLGIWALEAGLFFSIIAAAYASEAGRKTFLTIAGLAVLAVLLRAGWLLGSSDALLYVFLVIYVAMYSLVAFVLVGSIFVSDKPVTLDTLFSAISVYLIFGLLWTALYALLELAQPNSFDFGTTEPSDMKRFDRFMGFSFTTLTTLGYGNVAPRTPRADVLASMQAVVGQMYVAVVIARLVAIQITQSQRDKPEQRGK